MRNTWIPEPDDDGHEPGECQHVSVAYYDDNDEDEWRCEDCGQRVA